MKTTLLFAFALASSTSLLFASDNAGNYGSWTNGSNGGSGFGAWDLTNNNNNDITTFAGYFLGDSTAGAGNINTGGQSFGIYANPGGAFATANRSFASPLAVNSLFTVQLALNFDNGNKGMNLITGGLEALNFNVGSGGSVNSDFTNNPVTAQYDYGGGDAVIDIAILITSSSSLSYTVSRTSSLGFQGVLFSGSITGITGSIDSVVFYNSGTDAGGAPENNLYFNNLELSVIPEPGTYAAIIGLLALALVVRLRRK